MDIGLLMLIGAAISMMAVKWWESRREAKAYRDGIFAIIAILDLPVSCWEQRFRREMTDEQWFAFQRGYTQAFVDALNALDYQMQVRIHGARLQPRPDMEDSLSQLANR